MVATARRQLISTVGWLARQPITRHYAGVRGGVSEERWGTKGEYSFRGTGGEREGKGRDSELDAENRTEQK